MTILGIDPGTNIMGYAVLKSQGRSSEIVTLGVVKMNRTSNQEEKLKMIFESVKNLISTYQPDTLAIEEPFYGKNPQSMLKLGRAQGVVIGACIQSELSIHEYTPRRVKQSITGRGGASKEQVAAMLHSMYDFSTDTKYLDATDALGIAVCHHLQNGIELPQGPVARVKGGSWAAFIAQNQDRIIRK